MKNITLIVKPTHKCNLDCPYCYDKINRINNLYSGPMTFETVKKIASVFKDTARTWIWHGGEPLLMGVDFYYKANDIIWEISKDTEIAIQTNGTLINQDYINMFKKYNIQPGLAFDGIKNELTRRSTGRFFRAKNLLDQNNMEAGPIMLLTPDNIDNIIDEYEYFKRLNIIPQMNIIYYAIGNSDTETIKSEHLAEEICKFFDYWIMDSFSPTDSLLCTGYMDRLLNTGRSFCADMDCVGKWFGIHPTGELMPCGSCWQEDMTFGNIHDYNSTAEIVEHPNFVRFKKETRELLQSCKDKECPFFYACHGGCYAESYSIFNNCSKPEPGNCMATRIIFTHIFNRIKNIDISAEGYKYNPYFIMALGKTGFRNMDFINSYNKSRIGGC